MEERGKYGLVAAIVVVIIVLDQITKLWVASAMELHESIQVFPWLNLTYVRNTGAAFSMFSGQPAAFRVPFFTIVSLLAGGAIMLFIRQTPASQRAVLIASALVLGGAIGNLIDRLVYGEVIDFVDVHWRGMHWPAFNVADSCITVGVILLLLRTLFTSEEATARAPSRPAS
jgi:signal peptidase II